jgi:hypothetical protein
MLAGVQRIGEASDSATALVGRTLHQVGIIEGGAAYDSELPELPADARGFSDVDRPCAVLGDGSVRCLARGGWTEPAGLHEIVELSGRCARAKQGAILCDDAGVREQPHFAQVASLPEAHRLAFPYVELAGGEVIELRAGRIVPRPELHGITSISADPHSGSAACGLAQGHVVCWADVDRDIDGALGRDPARPGDPRRPARLSPDLEATAVVATGDGGCALDGGGAVWCWGSDHYGAQGRGRVIWSATPRRVVGLP